jgi:hypothetical protein
MIRIAKLLLVCAAGAVAAAQPDTPPPPPASTPAPRAMAAPAELRPYEASYAFVARGMNAGTSNFSLRRDGGDESHNSGEVPK